MRDVIITAQHLGAATSAILVTAAVVSFLIAGAIIAVVIKCLQAIVSPLFRAERENDSEPDAMEAINDDLPYAIHQAQRPERDFTAQPVMFPAPMARGGELG